MLKIRLQGTKQDIRWFSKILGRNKLIKVLQLSELFENKSTTKYYRAFAEIEKSEKNE